MRRRLLPVRLEAWLRFGSGVQLERMAEGSSCACCLVRRSLDWGLDLAVLLCWAFWNDAVVLTVFWSDRRNLADVIVSRS
jgi:hypothetical protein